MKHDLPKKPSTKLRDTHVIANPFLDSSGRYVHVCFCGYHTGIVHPSTLISKNHCGQQCTNIRRIYFNYKPLDEEKMEAELDKQRQAARSIPTVGLTPFEIAGQKYFWVLDRGEYVYFLRPEKAHLVQEVERDHKKVDISRLLLSNNFKPYFVE
ncbi:Uncharacterised protein [uncultured archaeon]|nr:Uncharacterised protein [uncultured archaeon]